MVLPFIGAIISAYILAFLVRPLFLKLKPRFGDSSAAILCIIIAIILVVVPVSLISYELLNQLGGVSKGQGIANAIDAFASTPFLKTMNVDTVALKAWIVMSLDDLVNSTIQSIPIYFLSLIITLNGMYYLLCRWDTLASHIKKYLPFNNNNEKIMCEIGIAAASLIQGNIIISVLEGAIAFVGFSLIGVHAPLILSVLIFILAFLPGIGVELVWIPLALYYLSINDFTTMAGVVLTGLILNIGVEMFFSARFIGNRSHIHPFIMLIGVFGGISVFGIFGFIIGPLLLAISIKLIEEAVVSHKYGKNKLPITNLKS
jgi:predicted PurR-regulated permease PerM